MARKLETLNGACGAQALANFCSDSPPWLGALWRAGRRRLGFRPSARLLGGRRAKRTKRAPVARRVCCSAGNCRSAPAWLGTRQLDRPSGNLVEFVTLEVTQWAPARGCHVECDMRPPAEARGQKPIGSLKKSSGIVSALPARQVQAATYRP